MSSQDQGAGSAAHRLAANRERVLAIWEERLRSEIPAAAREPHPILINTVPALLSHLVQALEPRHPRRTAIEGTTVAHEHGGERVRLTSFRLQDVIREYQLLRDVLFEVLEERPLTDDERRTVIASIDGMVTDACTAYVLVSEGLREQVMLALAHDLRGPLSAAKAGAGMILRRPDSPQVPRWAARIDENVDRAESMVRSILDVSRAGSGRRIALELARCDMVALVRQIIEDLTLTHGERFVLAMPTGASVMGNWSADALGRAIENLLDNGIKYGQSNRPITVSIRQAHGRVAVSVHNEGSYIPPADQENLFQAFGRTQHAVRSNVRGWGLGLALVRAVAEAHGGSIAVESLPEAGTTFIIDVPLDAAPFQDAPITPGTPVS